MKNPFNVPDYAVTHGAKFHADDVFSGALLRYMNPNIRIDRVLNRCIDRLRINSMLLQPVSSSVMRKKP